MLENDKRKKLLDFAIQTFKETEHRRPDIVVIDRQKRECKIISIAVKELEKITKYQDLRLEVQKLWNGKATVIPIAVGALEIVSEELENHVETIGVPIVSCLENAAFLGAAFILRMLLGSSESG